MSAPSYASITKLHSLPFVNASKSPDENNAAQGRRITTVYAEPQRRTQPLENEARMFLAIVLLAL